MVLSTVQRVYRGKVCYYYAACCQDGGKSPVNFARSVFPSHLERVKPLGLVINYWWPAGPSLGVHHGSHSTALRMKRDEVELSEVLEEWRNTVGLFCAVSPGEVTDNHKPFFVCIQREGV